MEEDFEDLLEFERSERFSDRQKAALAYASQLVWSPEGADAGVYARLREHFAEDQITELGYFVALTFGQQRWIKTLGIGHGETLNLSQAGLAPERPDAP